MDLLLALGLLWLVPVALAQEETLDLDAILNAEDTEEPIDDLLQELGAGDLKRFKIATDDNTAALNVGDMYKSNKSIFKVVGIDSQGEKGGKFTVERVAGRGSPGRTLERTSGDGPGQIVKRETLWDLFANMGRTGQAIMAAIALCGAITIVIGVNCFWVYRKARQCPGVFVEAARGALSRRDVQEFQNLSMKEKGLFGHICRAMAARFDVSTLEDIDQRCDIEAGRQIRRMRAPLEALSLMSAVAPLLGLLGTVAGMVTSFESVAYAAASASKAELLAAGIRVALFTTVAGLIVAIPALFIRYLASLRLSSVISECELMTEQFLHDVAQIKRNSHAAETTANQPDEEPATAAP
jgi:biopolymer transport protein ExbB